MKKAISVFALVFQLLAATAFADPPGKRYYDADCIGCHGADGSGVGSNLRMAPGYVAVDLRLLGKSHGGQFPREEVYRAIDGRWRIAPHFRGDMPRWGTEYAPGQGPNTEAEKEAQRRISALTDYIESLQFK